MFDHELALLHQDVAATVGREFESAVEDCVRHARAFAASDDRDFVQGIVDDVQQLFHDTFVDTSWPQCPRHANHPLWFRDG
jgi:hypothetical protein